MENNLFYRKCFFFIYVGLNVYFSFSYIFNNGIIGGDFIDSGITVNTESIAIAIINIIISYYVYMVCFFNLANKIKVRKVLIFNDFNTLNIVFFIIVIFYFYCSIHGGTSYDDFSKTGLPHIFESILVTFEVERLIYAYMIFGILKKSKLYYSNVVLMVVSNLIVGKTGVLIYLLPIYCLSKIYHDGCFSRMKITFFILAGLLLAPLVRFFKASIGLINSGKASDINDVATIYQGNSSYFDLYGYFFNTSFERFQHVSNLSFIIDNKKYLNSNIPDVFINNHITMYLFRSLFNIDKADVYLNSYLASMINGKTSWSTHSGISGVYYALGAEGLLYILIYSLLLFFIIVFAKKFDASNIMVHYVWMNALLLFWHGWLGPFYASCYALVLFYFVLVSVNLLSNNFKNRF